MPSLLPTPSQEHCPATGPLRRVATAAAVCAAAGLAAAGCSSPPRGSASYHGSGTSPTAHSNRSAPAGGGTSSASQAMSLAATQVAHISSFSATEDIVSTGSIPTHLTGTLADQVKPSVVAQQKLRATANGTAIAGGIDTVLTANAIYLKMSSLRAVTHKPWVGITFASLNNSTGVSLAPLVHEIQSSDPLLMERMLPAATNVRQLGTATVNGVATTEYKGVLNIATAMDKVDPGLRKLVQPIMSSLGISTDDFTVWLDSQHQVRKMVEVESGKDYQSTLVLVVTSINAPLHLSAPPASQVGALPGI